MMLELPLTSDPAQSFICQLGKKKLHFAVQFNSREAVWTLDLSDTLQATPLFCGVPLLLGTHLLEPYNLGLGWLFLVDSSNQGKDATSADLGSRVVLIWVSPDEVRA